MSIYQERAKVAENILDYILGESHNEEWSEFWGNLNGRRAAIRVSESVGPYGVHWKMQEVGVNDSGRNG